MLRTLFELFLRFIEEILFYGFEFTMNHLYLRYMYYKFSPNCVCHFNLIVLLSDTIKLALSCRIDRDFVNYILGSLTGHCINLGSSNAPLLWALHHHRKSLLPWHTQFWMIVRCKHVLLNLRTISAFLRLNETNFATVCLIKRLMMIL